MQRVRSRTKGKDYLGRITETLSGISGLLLSFPTLGYATPALFHTISLSLSSKLKFVMSTESTTSVDNHAVQPSTYQSSK